MQSQNSNSVKTVKITREALKNIFRSFNKNVSLTGVTFANIHYFNDVSKSSTVKGQKQLQKDVKVNITVGSDYESKVQRLSDDRGFESEDNWFFYKYGIENPVVASKSNPNKEYLVMIVENHTKRQTTYYHQGMPITIDEAKEQGLLQNGFFTEKKTAGRGTVAKEDDFDFNVLSFDNILSITLNKTLYIVED
jgi:hypothetical protein